MKKKICVVTGTRAEYGLLRNIISLIERDEDIDLQLIVTGMHLTSEYGNTFMAIEEDGHKIDKKIDILLSSGSEVGVAKSMGLATIGFAEAFQELRPDVLLVLGDRFEILSAAQAAMIHKIPICHIHGGETTEGLIDEAIRHSVTKMSHLHFTSTESYRKRVIQLGESEDRVFNVGAPGLDTILSIEALSKQELGESLGIEVKDRLFVITYHPVSLERISPRVAMNELIKSLKKYPDVTQIITLPNSDPNSKEIMEMIKEYSNDHPNVHAFTSLGQKRYISAIKAADVVIGNSSSGLIEVPFVKTPTINIGNRQKGRISGVTVIQCNEVEKEIDQAIEKSLSEPFKKIVAESTSLYGDGGSSKRIIDSIKNFNFDGVLFKKFNDLTI
jgi:GDP/UDP-N,N'-diacetylbacillosamine 2-epimerase (hydrolysing)